MNQRTLIALRGAQSCGPFLDRIGTKAAIFGGCFLLLATLLAARGTAEVIASCGFEPAGDTWSFSFIGGTFNTDSGSADSPANQRILSGSRSWLAKGVASTLTFSEVLLSGWSHVVVEYRISSTASGGQGNTSDDKVMAYVATTSYSNQASAVFGKVADVTLTGCGDGATWGYNSGAPCSPSRSDREESCAKRRRAANQ